MYIYLEDSPLTYDSNSKLDCYYKKWEYYYIRRAGYATGSFRRVAINLSAYQSRVKPETIARNVIAFVNRQKGLVPLARASRNINSFLILNKAPSQAKS